VSCDGIIRPLGIVYLNMGPSSHFCKHPYIIYPFYPLGDLEKLVGQVGPLSATVALKLAKDMAEAISVLHNAGFVHRDVKPSSFLVRALFTLCPVINNNDHTGECSRRGSSTRFV